MYVGLDTHGTTKLIDDEFQNLLRMTLTIHKRQPETQQKFLMFGISASLLTSPSDGR